MAVGWSNPGGPVTITVDLGSRQPIRGASLSTAAGRASVSFPFAVHTLVGDDGETFYGLGELVADSARHGLPSPTGYSAHVYRTVQRPAHGRYVRFVVVPSGQFFMCDEVEVYAGHGDQKEQPRGEPVQDVARLIASQKLTTIVKGRIALDLLSLEQRSGDAGLYGHLWEELHRMAAVDSVDWRRGVPYTDLHRQVFPVTCRRAAGVVMQTFVYKRVGNLSIKADVHRADDSVLRPLVVWIHGGALICGHRGGIDGRLLGPLLERGYAVVSIDYRLAPESQLPEIIADLEDAFAWVRKRGRELFCGDTERIASAGGSAGGYLTLTAGFRVEPRPACLISLWGYGDLVGEWYSSPSPHARHRTSVVPESEARRQVSGPPVADDRDREGDGGVFYQFCRQQGIWPREVSGWDPHADEDRFVPFTPVRNVSRDYPPTFLIHGTEDTDVPYEQSVMMAESFRSYGVEHELVSVAGGEHGLAGADVGDIEAAYEAALAFVGRHMGKV